MERKKLEFNEEKHEYTIDGEKVIGVSELVKMTNPYDSLMLERAAYIFMKMGQSDSREDGIKLLQLHKKMEAYTLARREQGKKLHKKIENLLTGHEDIFVEPDEKIDNLAAHYVKKIIEVRNKYAKEYNISPDDYEVHVEYRNYAQFISNDYYGDHQFYFAGTIDLILFAKNKSHVLVIDYKSGSDLKLDYVSQDGIPVKGIKLQNVDIQLYLYSLIVSESFKVKEFTENNVDTKFIRVAIGNNTIKEKGKPNIERVSAFIFTGRPYKPSIDDIVLHSKLSRQADKKLEYNEKSVLVV